MDMTHALGTEIRAVRDTEHDGQPARAVEGSRLYPTDIDDLWDALTNAERLPGWFLPISGDLEVGGRYKLEGNAEGSITRCDPPRALDLTWEFGGNTSWVTLRLSSEGDDTRLTLVHTMGKDEASEAHWASYGPGATGLGWDLSFLGLGWHLDAGQALDRPAVDAWMASDDGRSFMRACADGWAEAHVASGVEVERARTMADATFAAYTGG